MTSKKYVPGAGDVTIVLGEETLVLKPTLNAGLVISRQSGGIRGAIDKVMSMDIDTIAGVIRLGIGAEEAKRVKNVEKLVWENGLLDSQGEVLGKCVEYLSNLARGGKPADAEDEETKEGGENPNPQ